MWLININTGRLEAFNDDSKKRPDYAILSHTWGSDDEELSFQDLQASEPKTGPGRDKFEACCTLAKWDQLEYAWIDTCCIDKTTINSMFKWYRDAKICYAYLSDVAESTPAEPESDFGRSRWFQRGWTLQELIAPPIVRFFNAEWKYLGDKATLATVVEQITQIPRLVLLGHIQLKEASIAQRMSWAANRVTKRKEDIAYCLLGIFDVMMPMLYGEGERAFIRLQEAILLSQPNDDSILAWGNIPRSSRSVTFPTGAFASAPSDFLRCGQVICTTSSDSDDANVLTLQGRSVRLRRPLYAHPSSQLYIVLRCRFYDEPERCIALSVQPWSSGVNNYCRDGKRSVISVRKRDLTAQNENVRIMIDQSSWTCVRVAAGIRKAL
ncbi:heterokaryon incompatibility protein-domain-containing protein [Xylariaceae sp. FL1272]|nr:heterokaryon incompatibility protein-domain-containing protein [Xylariaceae sp. FL1272]